MTTVPGTYYTKEQLEDDLKVDDVSDDDRTGSDRLNWIGLAYYFDKKQYDKAVAWYILAAMENNSIAQNSIGFLYYNGYGVPENYLCALKWLLKSAERFKYENTPNTIGKLFEYGQGVPLDKYRALEWYCHGEDKANVNRLKSEGYHMSAADKKKPLEQLKKETEAILETEKKKLENKQDKTQQEIETLEQLNITYKVTGGGQNAWKDVPVLLATSKQRYTESLNISATHNEDEILELKKQIQLLKQERSTFESQAKQLPPLKQEESNLQRQIKERDRQQGANEMVDTLKSLLQSKKNEIELNNLKMENALDKEKGKVKKLLKEIKKLKQQQTVSSWEARPSSSTTVPESTASNIGTNEDDPNNDFNYDTECGAKNSNTDDTSSEDNANDLNYDSDV